MVDPREQRIAALEEQVAALLAEIEFLRRENAALKEQLGLNSRNSSLPPSQDPPGTLRSPKQPTGKKRGGQPGHKGAHRALLPPEQVTEVRGFRLPDQCPDCASSLPAERHVRRRQIWEVPKIVPHVLEIRQECTTCPGCRRELAAQIPSDIPRGDFGPNVVALAAIFRGRFGLSNRDCKELFTQVLGIEIGLGTIPRLSRQASYALKDFHDELHQYMCAQERLNADDTAWKEGKEYRVMFALNTPDAAFFKIEDRKNHKTVRDLLGSFAGCLGVDRASTYSCHSGRLQHCLAHMDRHFLRIWDRGGDSQNIGAQGRQEMDRIWAAWRAFTNGECDRPQLKVKLKPIRARMGKLLKAGVACGVKKTANTCARVLKAFGSMWTFVDLEDVEPTNNISEQALRLPVCWRRTSFFSQSAEGLRFTERILSAVLTCSRRGTRIWDFLAEKCAQKIGVVRPTLAPG